MPPFDFATVGEVAAGDWVGRSRVDVQFNAFQRITGLCVRNCLQLGPVQRISCEYGPNLFLVNLMRLTRNHYTARF